MPLVALLSVLLAACTHATWNLYAKRAAASRHFVWMYSVGSILMYSPAVLWILIFSRPHFGPLQYAALLATALLHLAYSVLLQAGYRASDLSLVYPIARGSGPLLSFVTAVVLLGEPISWQSGAGVVLIVCGILLVSGLLHAAHDAPKSGIWYGLATGTFIAAYTINDGWAVKVLLVPPLLIDYCGNLFRAVVLTPAAWRDRVNVREEIRLYARSAAVVSLLGPMGYILVLYAMRIAPISHVAPARELATLIGTWFGARLLKEKAAPARIAGAACIVVGVIALAVT
jgi:drug/metabolite transporter (DMT)-like permease